MAFGTPFTKAQLDQIRADDAADHGADETGEWAYDDGRHATGTTTMSIRLPISVVAALKDAALVENIGATVLARRWILERLAAPKGTGSGVVAVADLLELVARSQTPPPASASPPVPGVKARTAPSKKPSTAAATARTPAPSRTRAAAKVAPVGAAAEATKPAAAAAKAAKKPAKAKSAPKVEVLSR